MILFYIANYLVACRFELASSTSGSGDGAGDIFPVVAKLMLTLIVHKICICKTKKIVHKITVKHDFIFTKKNYSEFLMEKKCSSQHLWVTRVY